MDIAVNARHVDLPAELRSVAAEKATHLERFLDGTQRAEIFFTRDHAARDDGHVSCEVVVVARGRSVRARASGQRATVALEAAINKEAQRLARMKERLVERSRPRHGAPPRRTREAGPET
jgi:ribosomal subunit interface protein